MTINIRPFKKEDIPLKVEWINNPLNNKYLHYNLPLKVENTLKWFEKNKNRTDRYDATIVVDNRPVGLIGLLGIDRKNSKAEYYITIGERDYLGKGIAFEATKLLLEYGFVKLCLNKIFLYTEEKNISAQKLFEKIGFQKEGLIKDNIFYNNKYINRFLYSFFREDYFQNKETPILFLGEKINNQIFIKRDDLFPFSFGGNKARKGILFREEIKKKKANYIVTYGSSSSNHCRVIANIACSEGIPCCIISPEEIAKETYNKKMMKRFGAQIKCCQVSEVHMTIKKTMISLKNKGYKPYFIQGGGHGNLGTQAYVNCYDEIREYEKSHNIVFDYIFFASGTGTTQAGLVCGKIMRNASTKIIGISIARKSPYGRDIVIDSIREYFGEKITNQEIDDNVIFEDSYIFGGYGETNNEIMKVMDEVLCCHGIPLDSTYTGKAFYGMNKYIEKNKISGKNILFIHTGGTPLFFDELGGSYENKIHNT